MPRIDTVMTFDVETGAAKEVPMSEDQVKAVDTIIDGNEYIYRLCGGAGVGKSAIVDALAEELNAKVCATTARAALHIGGCTVDSLFCFRRGTWKTNNERLERVMEDTGRWIIIDEASMIGDKMADCIYHAVDWFDKKLILVGDWAQAPPVKERWPLRSPLLSEGITVSLSVNHRQGAGEYVDALNKLRTGEIDSAAADLFRSRIKHCPQDDEYTYMYGTNSAAAAHNRIRIAKHAEGLKMTPIEVTADFWSKYEMELDRRDQLLEHSRMCHGEKFCYMAKVMMTKNVYGRGYVNGDMGRIVSIFTADSPVVELSELKAAATDKNGTFDNRIFCQTHGELAGEFVVGFLVELDRDHKRVFVMEETEEVVSALGVPLYRVTGFPIRLAWAMTVHKAQGATLDKAYLATNSLWHEHGLMYVGLSRTRTIEGLLLESWRPDLVKCDYQIKPYI